MSMETFRAARYLRPFSTLKAEEFSCSGNERQCEHGDDHLADCAHGKRPQSLFSHLAEVGAQTNTGESQQESPPRKVRQSGGLLLGEEVVGGQDRNEQESKDEFREFLPEKSCLVAHRLGLPLAGPVN